MKAGPCYIFHNSDMTILLKSIVFLGLGVGSIKTWRNIVSGVVGK